MSKIRNIGLSKAKTNKGTGVEGRSKLYAFRNAEGKTIELPGHATIEDVVKMGVTRVRLKKEEEPIEPGEWRECGS